MNDERDTADMERLVSETYRAAATERVPEHLSEKILHTAAEEPTKQQQRSAYGFASSWLRPAAWVATISLSLAIVLEITQDPALEVSQPAASTPVPAADTAIGRREETVVEVTAAPEMLRTNKMRAPPMMPAERTVVAADNPVVASDSLAEDSILEQPKMQDRNAVEEFESMARKRADPKLQKELLYNVDMNAMGIMAATVDENESDADRACDSASRETAESWFACIQMLSDTGRAADAAGEFDEFTLKFPNFTPH